MDLKRRRASGFPLSGPGQGSEKQSGSGRVVDVLGIQIDRFGKTKIN